MSIHTVITDQGVCHKEYLPGVRGIGERLGITGHRRVEYYLAKNIFPGTEEGSFDCSTILEYEDCSWHSKIKVYLQFHNCQHLVCLVCLVRLVYLVCLVTLVYLVYVVYLVVMCV